MRSEQRSTFEGSQLVVRFGAAAGLSQTRFVLGLLVSALFSASPIADQTCGVWEGTITGNDPKVTARLLLCRRGSELCGQMAWAGQSGDAVRELTGSVRGEGLELADTRFLRNRPARGWRFCLAEGYRLDKDKTSGALVGRYWSTACHDEASLSLAPVKRVEQTLLVSCFAR